MRAGRALRRLPFQRVPARTLLITAAVSYALLLGGIIEGLPLWAIGLMTVLPWVPALTLEAIWQYDHYGFYAVFGAIVLLQLGHIGEHTSQLIQLVLTHGNLSRSHGIFGQLDLEAVHFYWNIGVWLGAAAIFYRFGAKNRWLWIALFTASFHMVEHFYLYWLYLFQHDYWVAGGSAGILAHGGMIGSPLDRPYLHFAYNFLEVTPLVVAFWVQTKLVYDQHLARALPALSEVDLVRVTSAMRRIAVPRGEVIIRQGEIADRVYIVSKGEVEIFRETPAGIELLGRLRAGQLFGKADPLAGDRRTVTVRATRSSEVLAIEHGQFASLVAR